MAILSVSLFGRAEIRDANRSAVQVENSRLKELFYYLLVYRERPHPREALADLLWSDQTGGQARKYLRQALWRLQSILTAHLGDPGQEILLVEPNWVQLNPKASLWLDVACFEEAYRLVQGRPGEELDRQTIQLLKETVDLYRGNLLDGWYQDWCLFERERLQNSYLAMLDKLMAHCQASHQYEVGMLYGTRILSYDQTREHTYRQLMRLHYLAGDRGAALHVYEQCVTVLAQELDITPTGRTTDLYRQIRADRVDSLSPPPFPPRNEPLIRNGGPPLTQLLSRLKDLQTMLQELQAKVEAEIQTTEQILDSRR